MHRPYDPRGHRVHRDRRAMSRAHHGPGRQCRCYEDACGSSPYGHRIPLDQVWVITTAPDAKAKISSKTASTTMQRRNPPRGDKPSRSSSGGGDGASLGRVAFSRYQSRSCMSIGVSSERMNRTVVRGVVASGWGVVARFLGYATQQGQPSAYGSCRVSPAIRSKPRS